MRTACVFVAALALAIAAAAQTGAAQAAAAQTPANPLTAAMQSAYDLIKGNITKSAEKVSEEHYSFKPSPDVRTFGQILGHIADANYMICSAAGGSAAPPESIEKTKTTKADLQKALADSFSACDAAYAAMTDAKGVEIAKFFGREQPKLGVLAFNTAARLRALRQPGDLHAHEGHRAALERAGTGDEVSACTCGEAGSQVLVRGAAVAPATTSRRTRTAGSGRPECRGWRRCHVCAPEPGLLGFDPRILGNHLRQRRPVEIALSPRHAGHQVIPHDAREWHGHGRRRRRRPAPGACPSAPARAGILPGCTGLPRCACRSSRRPGSGTGCRSRSPEIASASMRFLCRSANASPSASIMAAIRKLPASFTRFAACGSAPTRNTLLAHHLEQRLHACKRGLVTGRHDRQLAGFRGFGPAEHRRGDEVLSRLRVRLGEAHRQVGADRAE